MSVEMEAKIWQTVAERHERWVQTRREFHTIPEPGFCEYRTATAIVDRLRMLEYDIAVGNEAMELTAAHSLPGQDGDAWYESAVRDARDPELLREMRGGATGVVATRRFGPGPVVAFRFDIDGLPITESRAASHRPRGEGFASAHEGWMHACGHDGHITLGLGVAEILAELAPHMPGAVKLLFQPAEEGTKGGAAAMAARGHLDDVDLMIAAHLGLNADTTGVVACDTTFMGTFKYRVRLTGRAAHVVLAPHTGRNALLAATAAVQGLHGLAPHPDGWFSVNVGRLTSGTEQGITPAGAEFDFGAWYAPGQLEDYLRARCEQVVYAAALGQGVEAHLEVIGEAPWVEPDPNLGQRLARIAERVPGVSATWPSTTCKAGEDATVMIRRAREHGADATYVLIGSNLTSGHHTPEFDFDEAALDVGIAVLSTIALRAGL